MDSDDFTNQPRDTPPGGLAPPKTKGDRVLLLAIALAVGAPAGGLLYALSALRDSPPSTFGDFALLELVWLLFALSAASAVWALYQPRWMADVVRNLATKTLAVTLLAVCGVLLWLLLLLLDLS